MGDDRYLHGTSPAEQDRLSRMNDLINAACLRQLELRGERQVLDVGSGLGQFTRQLARALGDGVRVVAVEGDAAQLAAARRLAAAAGETDLVEFRHGRAEALPLGAEERGRFDLVHARFLLEHHRRPAAVVAEMAAALRPGGRLLLLDDDHDVLRMHPEPPAAMTLWRAYARSYERIGCDPFVGRRLPALLHGAGVRPVRTAVVPYGACAGERHFAALVENLVRVMDSAEVLMCQEGLAAPADFAGMRAELAAWQARQDAVLWYGICLAEGRVADKA